MQFRRSPGMRAIDSAWHRERARAREQAYSSTLEGFFSETEITKFELRTAQIDGSDNPEVWDFDRPLDMFGINDTDVRELHNR